MKTIDSTDIVDITIGLVRTASTVLVDDTDAMANDQSPHLIGAHFSNALLSFAVEQNLLWPLLETEYRYKNFYKSRQTEIADDPILDGLREHAATNAYKIADQLKSVLAGITPMCEPLLLKGACFVAEDDFQPQPWRYMDDLDLLVDASHLRATVEAVRSLGYKSETDSYHVDSDVHFPILKHPSLPAGIEIHERCMRWPVKGLLDNATIWSSASTINGPYGRYLLPNANMRLAYVVANAQIKDNCFRRRVLRLRDIIDFTVLLENNNADLDVVHAMFQEVRKEDEFLSFVYSCELALQRYWLSPADYRNHHKRWAEAAFAGLRDPSILKRYLIEDWVLLAGSILAKPSRWKGAYRMLTLGEKRRRHVEQIRQQFQSLR